tara:strand:- start:3373 stop:3642 length:270 start_codon:yes stop_codon:yes gene_type:complete
MNHGQKGIDDFEKNVQNAYVKWRYWFVFLGFTFLALLLLLHEHKAHLWGSMLYLMLILCPLLLVLIFRVDESRDFAVDKVMEKDEDSEP